MYSIKMFKLGNPCGCVSNIIVHQFEHALLVHKSCASFEHSYIVSCPRPQYARTSDRGSGNIVYNELFYVVAQPIRSLSL